MRDNNEGPRVLLLDIETAPLLGYVWGLWENNVALNQIYKDWHILSWSAKWFKDESGNLYGPHDKVMYMDQRRAPNVEDDTKILKGIWALLDEADIIVTQNGKSFDQRKLQARFILNGMKPTSTYRHIDTKLIAQKHFALSSHKLEYMTDKLCVKYKKQTKHGKFQGFEMWKECLKGNLAAWREMEKYNKYDVLSLEELFIKLIPWDSSINFSVYTGDDDLLHKCTCGSKAKLQKYGYAHTNLAKYHRYKCTRCGKETRGRTNLLSTEKRKSLQGSSNR